MGAIFKYGGSILSGEGIEFTKGHDDAVKFFVASVVADILKNILRLWSTVRALSPSVLYGCGRKVRADAVMFPFSQGLRVQTRAATHISIQKAGTNERTASGCPNRVSGSGDFRAACG
nr:hypothetical protein [uncultured Desulfovibrio sp.]